MQIVTAEPTKQISLNSILLATDLFPRSEKAVRHAAEIAGHYGAKLYLVHVVSSLGFAMTVPDSIPLARDAAVRDLRAVERSLVVSGALAGVDHEAIIAEGEVWRAIEGIAKQKGVDMIVAGTHYRTGVAKLVLGSTAELIFRNASCPVLTVGPFCPMHSDLAGNQASSPVLFPTDFTEESLKALPYAASLANEQKTGLVLQHLIRPTAHADRVNGNVGSEANRRGVTETQYCIERLRRLVENVGLIVPPICIADFGEPAEGILSAAENLNIKVIVMGLKGENHMSVVPQLTWSTAYKVVCNSRCPVLTVRASYLQFPSELQLGPEDCQQRGGSGSNLG